MLQGTSLANALQLWHGLGNDNEDDLTGLNANGDDGYDIDDDGGGGGSKGGDNNNRSGPTDGPPIFSEVTLALRRGVIYLPTLSEILTYTLSQPQSIPPPHSRHSVNT